MKLKMKLGLLFLQSHRPEGAVGKYQAGGLNGTFSSNHRLSQGADIKGICI